MGITYGIYVPFQTHMLGWFELGDGSPTGPILVQGCPRRRRSRVSDSELDVITVVAGVGYLVTYHDAIWIPVDGSKRLS